MAAAAQLEIFVSAEQPPACSACGHAKAKNGHGGSSGTSPRWYCNRCRPKLVVTAGGVRIDLGRTSRDKHTRLRHLVDVRTEQIKEDLRGT